MTKAILQSRGGENSKQPLVYIVMPCYNSEKYLLEQLLSIYHQNYKNRYLIFVNDGATDTSLEIVQKFVSDYKLKDKVIIITKENGGVNSAVQRGLEEVKNLCDIYNTDSLVSFCDADDIRAREKLSVQVEYMVNHPECDLSYHDMAKINENGVLTEASRFGKCLKNRENFFYIGVAGNFCTSTEMMFRPKYIDDILPMPTGFGMYQDFWTALIFLVNDYKIQYIDKPLSYYRSGHTSLMKIAKETDKKKTNASHVSYYHKIQEKYPEKDISYFVNYQEDRFIKRYDKYGLIHPMVYLLMLTKYPKIFFFMLNVFMKEHFNISF